VKKIKTLRDWYKNGNISEEKTRLLKDDCPSCDWSFHNVNYEYEDSIVKKWFENGNLKYENYTDSIIKEWFENGNLMYEIIKKHERILSEKRYYTNGNIKYEYFKSIEGDGYEKWWNEKGVLQCEGLFDKRSKWDKKYWKGTFKTYDDERLISIEHYEEGEKSGVHKYWDENDRLTESAFYSEEQIEEEKQKFVAWKKNTRFSISYKVEIVNNIIKCSYCSYKKVNKNLNFPNLNLSNYGNEKYMRKLWDEHKQIIESEIIGNIGFRNHPVFDEAIFGRECKNCGRPRVEDKKSTFENKTFKN
jgi:antitoxin component YwqK of YwqJK toxin-antitoxin module